jgi:hypothetical protein
VRRRGRQRFALLLLLLAFLPPSSAPTEIPKRRVELLHSLFDFPDRRARGGCVICPRVVVTVSVPPAALAFHFGIHSSAAGSLIDLTVQPSIVSRPFRASIVSSPRPGMKGRSDPIRSESNRIESNRSIDRSLRLSATATRPPRGGRTDLGPDGRVAPTVCHDGQRTHSAIHPSIHRALLCSALLVVFL